MIAFKTCPKGFRTYFKIIVLDAASKGTKLPQKIPSYLQINQSSIFLLQALQKLYQNTNDKWRALGYSKAIAALKKHPKPITSFEV